MIYKIAFWSSVFFIVYSYFGYPIILKIISLFKNIPINKGNYEPFVTLIISAYNEECVIAEKIENSLNLEYPKDMIEIMVVSDASTDRTDEIVQGYKERGIKTIRIEGRVGKTVCLNYTVPNVKGEIIVFSDANSLYDRNAIKNIVKNFADSHIGFVTGCTKYVSRETKTVLESISLYSAIEKLTKKLESEIGSCVGADGAIFAIRKKLYPTLRNSDINDFVIPLKIVMQNYRGVVEFEAFCYEDASKNRQSDFGRQIRITNRTIRAIFQNAELLNVTKYGLFSFELISHKLFKFFVPFVLIISFFVNIILLKKGAFYQMIFVFHLSFYLFSALGLFKISLPGISRLISICNTFIVVNIAIICGWVKYLKGDTYTTWDSK